MSQYTFVMTIVASISIISALIMYPTSWKDCKKELASLKITGYGLICLLDDVRLPSFKLPTWRGWDKPLF